MNRKSLAPSNRTIFLIAVCLVLLVAAMMRLVYLQDIPPGLAQDEVLNADIARSIQGGRLTLFFREGFGHEPLYHYLTAYFSMLLGDNYLAIRLPSVFLGLLLIAAGMRWSKRDFGRVASVVAGFGLAVSWWPILFSRTGIRPILEPLLLILVAWLWFGHPWWAGLTLGLTMYSYTAARFMLLLPVLMMVYAFVLLRDRTERIVGLKSSAIILVVALVTCLPLYFALRNEPSSQDRVAQLSGPLTSLGQGDPAPVLEMTLDTLGVFSISGEPRPIYSPPDRPLFDPLTSVLFYGGLVIAVVRIRQAKFAFILSWLLLALVPSMITPRAPSTVRLIGAIPVVYLMLGLSVSWATDEVVALSLPKPGWRYLKQAFVFGLIVLLVLNIFLTVRDGFVRWPKEPKTRGRYQTMFLEIARHWQQNQEKSPVIAEGFFEPIDRDSVRRNLGSDIPARWVQQAGAIVFPSNEEGLFYVPEYAPPDPVLAELGGFTSEPLYRSSGDPSFAVYDIPVAPQLTTMPPPVLFDDMITLNGYEIIKREDRSWEMLTQWRADQQLPWDLAIFIHVIAPDGSIVAQHDGLDAVPAELKPGDVFIQRHVIDPPEVDPEGPCVLQMGLYRRWEGSRLEHGGDPPDRVILSENHPFCSTN